MRFQGQRKGSRVPLGQALRTGFFYSACLPFLSKKPNNTCASGSDLRDLIPQSLALRSCLSSAAPPDPDCVEQRNS